MRLYPFRKPEPNPWTEFDAEHPPPPLGIHPLYDLMAVQHSIMRALWNICQTHEAYGRAIRWQGAVLIFVSLVNVWWALIYWGHSKGWW